MSTPILPWYFKIGGDPHNQGLIIEEQTGRTVAVSYDGKDAPLIAAASEMIQALRDIIDLTFSNDYPLVKERMIRSIADRAILKTTIP